MCASFWDLMWNVERQQSSGFFLVRERKQRDVAMGGEGLQKDCHLTVHDK